MNLTITPHVQNNSKFNTSFGLKADKGTRRLINRSNMFRIKDVFHDLLHDKSTDHLTLTIKKDAVKGSFKYIAGLKDSRYPYAKAINDSLTAQEIREVFNNYTPINGNNDLRQLASDIFLNEQKSPQENLEFLSNVLLKHDHEKFAKKIVGLPVLNNPEQDFL